MSQLLLIQAADFAALKHRDQRRKGINATPYVNHPIAVARILAEVAQLEDSQILAAALLHDTIEDTATSAEEIQALFGEVICSYVQEVTDDKSLEKAERKRLQIEHAPHLSIGAAMIKIADKITNVRDITEHPPEGWDRTRRLAYLDWAESVVKACPAVNQALSACFAESLAHARKVI